MGESRHRRAPCTVPRNARRTALLFRGRPVGRKARGRRLPRSRRKRTPLARLSTRGSPPAGHACRPSPLAASSRHPRAASAAGEGSGAHPATTTHLPNPPSRARARPRDPTDRASSAARGRPRTHPPPSSPDRTPAAENCRGDGRAERGWWSAPRLPRRGNAGRRREPAEGEERRGRRRRGGRARPNGQPERRARALQRQAAAAPAKASRSRRAREERGRAFLRGGTPPRACGGGGSPPLLRAGAARARKPSDFTGELGATGAEARGRTAGPCADSRPRWRRACTTTPRAAHLSARGGRTGGGPTLAAVTRGRAPPSTAATLPPPRRRPRRLSRRRPERNGNPARPAATPGAGKDGGGCYPHAGTAPPGTANAARARLGGRGEKGERERGHDRRGAAGRPARARARHSPPVMILPQVHLRKPCYDFYFL